MNIITIVGARPQFIKAAAVSRAIAQSNIESCHLIKETIVHTGQHFDKNMSEIFFSELSIPTPQINLNISDLPHGAMIGRMLEAIEKVLIEKEPDLVIVYGDTNSTFAGALAACKLHIPVGHIESGLRSFNMNMPEEINRILTDNISKYLFCPTEIAKNNLKNQNSSSEIFNVGDVMYDTALFYQERVKNSDNLKKLGIKKGNYSLCTIHREENTNDMSKLKTIFNALKKISSKEQVVIPMHPRTKKLIIEGNHESLLKGIKIIKPVSYLIMLELEMSANIILTDSGGVQKEAFYFNVPCITLRNETEWLETVSSGFNILTGSSTNKILNAYKFFTLNGLPKKNCHPYGKGSSAKKIIEILIKKFKKEKK